MGTIKVKAEIRKSLTMENARKPEPVCGKISNTNKTNQTGRGAGGGTDTDGTGQIAWVWRDGNI